MLTVLLPVRDGASTLPTALGSLEAQKRPPERILAIDDGSTDSTPRVLTQWKARLPRLEILRTDGIGIAGALNLGLIRAQEAAEMKYCARMDADDRSTPERFAEQIAAAEAQQLALCSCEVTHWGGGANNYEGMRRHIEWANRFHSHEELAQALWIDSPLPHPTWLVRRDAVERVGLYNELEQLPEDYEWLHRFFAVAREDQSMRAGKLASPLLDWADSESRLTRTSKAYSETAFNLVKARSLARFFSTDLESTDLFIFSLGPKSKALFPHLRHELKAALRAIVDVHPRRQGIAYNGVRVCSVDEWRSQVKRSLTLKRRPFVLICVGTPEARASCEALCQELGLCANEHRISL